MIKTNNLDEYQTLKALTNYASFHDRMNGILDLSGARTCEGCDLKNVCKYTNKSLCGLEVEFEGENHE